VENGIGHRVHRGNRGDRGDRGNRGNRVHRVHRGNRVIKTGRISLRSWGRLLRSTFDHCLIESLNH